MRVNQTTTLKADLAVRFAQFSIDNNIKKSHIVEVFVKKLLDGDTYLVNMINEEIERRKCI